MAGMFFGSCAVAWLFVLAYLAFRDKYIEEAYMLVALSLWLLGKNFILLLFLFVFNHCFVVRFTENLRLFSFNTYNTYNLLYVFVS